MIILSNFGSLRLVAIDETFNGARAAGGPLHRAAASLVSLVLERERLAGQGHRPVAEAPLTGGAY